jgi:hypothetical protein
LFHFPNAEQEYPHRFASTLPQQISTENTSFKGVLQMKKITRILLVLAVLACSMPIPTNAFADGTPKCGSASC